MERLSQEYILRLALIDSIDREELLLKKYGNYYNTLKNNELKELLKEFEDTSMKHIETMKEKIMKLNFEG